LKRLYSENKCTTLLTITLLVLAALPAYADSKNGFDLSGSLIPATEILHGGPPRDGIPAIDKPHFVSAAAADFLGDDDRVLGIERNGIAKAYPIAILNWHEIVNDRFGDERIVVSFCPLCGTGVAFSVASGTFGVSGLLYNSDVLLYDRQSLSLWSQLLSRAVSGPHKGSRLKKVVLSHTNWRDWRSRHPSSVVLSTDTGSPRDYQRDPYAGYVNDAGIFFPVSHRDPRYHPKERVIGVEIAGHFKAYPFSELARSNGIVHDTLNKKMLIIRFDATSQSGRIFYAEGNEKNSKKRDQKGEELPTITAFWFAWYAFHPETKVYTYAAKPGP